MRAEKHFKGHYVLLLVLREIITLYFKACVKRSLSPPALLTRAQLMKFDDRIEEYSASFAFVLMMFDIRIRG